MCFIAYIVINFIYSIRIIKIQCTCIKEVIQSINKAFFNYYYL